MYKKKSVVLAFFSLLAVSISVSAVEKAYQLPRIKSTLPKCKGQYSIKWHNCFGEVVVLNPREGSYKGEFQNGLFNGQGLMTTEDGAVTYFGAFKDGVENGSGTQIIKIADYVSKTTGIWIDGKQQGKGFTKNSDGSSYEGNFVDGLSDGQGIEINEKNEKYVGEFKFNKRHGSGTIISPDGSRFIGSFKGGEKFGYGAEFDASGKKIFAGHFIGGKRAGLGYRLNSNGQKFDEGVYEHGVLVRKETINEDALESSFRPVDVLDFIIANPNNLPTCPIKSNGSPYLEKISKKCWWKIVQHGHTFMGEYENSKATGLRAGVLAVGYAFIGEEQDGVRNGKGIEFAPDGSRKEGIWQSGELIREVKVDLPIFLREKYLEAKVAGKQSVDDKNSKKITLQAVATTPSVDGIFTLNIKTNSDTASLKINGEEQGGSKDGIYTIKKFARAGQESDFTIIATDTNGYSATKTITVSRPLADSRPIVAALNPAKVKRQQERDAVAIVIGIADYKNLPRADFANDDARVFYDYAIRALGVKPENIKLLVDADADEVGIYRAFKTWLPSRVSSTTDVYVYYSGHGLPTADGQGLYVLPQRADKDFIDKTAITQAEINAAIEAAKPKSVTIFLDACYSGQARTGETLLAGARPVSLRAATSVFPDSFTVITASKADQISSSSPELKHGIFSYYLMRGMEGDADANRDGKITAGEMQAYLAETVSRQAGMMNRKQEPQLIGDVNRVIVGR
jgi:hypothetical protein